MTFLSRDFARRPALLAGVSALALLAAPQARAAAPAVFSQAWFAARAGAQATAATAASTAAGATARALASARSLQNLTDMAARIRSQAAAQASAAALGRAAAALIPNGLTPGGLLPQAGATAGSPAWLNAELPTATTGADGRAKVSVKQTGSAAVLGWSSFNVGRRTDLTFVQKDAAGTDQRGWVVLNRVTDPTASPSQILGSITAPGRVFVLNRNGILFGAGSQVNVTGLVASTASIDTAQFLDRGLYGTATATAFQPSLTGAPSASVIAVEAGAAIATPEDVSAVEGGGAVLLLAKSVTNAGAITTPKGQTVLAGGTNFILRQGLSTDGNATSTTRGTEVAVTGGGTATNTGIVTATFGDITMVGRTVTQAGVVRATTGTGLTERGSVHLLTDTSDSAGLITLAPGSVTAVQPDDQGGTAPDAQRNSQIARAATLNAQRALSTLTLLNDIPRLDDRPDLSRIEIATGGTVAFGGNSLTLTNGGQIAVAAGRRVFAERGAQLDVSGSTGASLSATANLVTVSVQTTPLRDSPVNRLGGRLTNTSLTIDLRSAITVPGTTGYGGNVYSGGGLVEVSGLAAAQEHGITEWTAVGGTIALNAAEVVVQSGATLNVAGGGVTYAGARVAQSYLIGPDGRLYNANTAPTDIAYRGVYNGVTEDHPRWSVTEVFRNPLIAPEFLTETGYTVGRDAGVLRIGAPTVLMSGAIDAAAFSGVHQIAARPASVTDGYALAQAVVPLAGTLDLTGVGVAATPALYATTVTIGDDDTLADSLTARTGIPSRRQKTAVLGVAGLNRAGLGGLRIATAGSVSLRGALTLADGGSLTVLAPRTTLGADVTARGGRIGVSNASPIDKTVVYTLGNRASVAVAAGATLDLRGLWSNAVADPTRVAGLGRVAGGSVALRSTESLTLGTDSLIDVSSGGGILANGATLAGSGGSVSLVGDSGDGSTTGTAPVLLGGRILGFGGSGGGTLTIQALSVAIGGTAGRGGLALAPGFFQTGFRRYDVNGVTGLSVAPATTLSLAAATYQFTPASPSAPTGEDPDQALQLAILPLYTEDPVRAALTQRQGVSLVLRSERGTGIDTVGGGNLTLGAGALLAVDPLQSVRLEAYGQITVDGTISAPSGTVGVVNLRTENATRLSAIRTGLSVWLGTASRIDVAGTPAVAFDRLGRPYGTVPDGGRVTIGSDNLVDSDDGSIVSTDAAVLVRPGAVVDASGSAATLDLDAGLGGLALGGLRPGRSTDRVLVASSGGTIALSSYVEVLDQGVLRAVAGGPAGTSSGASGGTLSLTIETPKMAAGTTTPFGNAYRQPHVVRVSQTGLLATSPALLPGAALPTASFGQIPIGVDQIAAGGFGSLAFFARDGVLFDGDVTLATARSISLTAGSVDDTQATGHVRIAAPSVVLRRPPTQNLNAESLQGLAVYEQTAEPRAALARAQGTLTVAGDLIDLAGLATGLSGTISLTHGTRDVAFQDFGLVSLNSTGDVRLSGALATTGSVTITAAQIYPTTGQTASLTAGIPTATEYRAGTRDFAPGSVLHIASNGQPAPFPQSVGGSLTLLAATIDQAGIVRAPEGLIALGTTLNDQRTTAVTLDAGSLTSVSLEGHALPYGGTADGLIYSYAGLPVGTLQPGVSLSARGIVAASGSTLDIAGGGELLGAGFLAGRGGSADVLANPLPRFTATSYVGGTLATNPVYAILPSFTGNYAPVTPAEQTGPYAGTAPALGARVTIAQGVPGLPAGTYTLLPSTYALLPGGFRVQFDPGRVLTTAPQARSDGSSVVAVTRSVADTGVSAVVPVALTVTPGAVVRTYSQYIETSFSQFRAADAALHGVIRSAVPADAANLTMTFVQPADTASSTGLALALRGSVLASPAPGGFGATASVTVVAAGSQKTALEVLADGAAGTPGFVSIAASDLDTLGVARLVLGGTVGVTINDLRPKVVISGEPNQTVVRHGATVRAGEIVMSATLGTIAVEGGATLDTIGRGDAPFGPAIPTSYSAELTSLLVLSNGSVAVDAPGARNQSAIEIGAGAGLVAEQTLAFATASSLLVDPTAAYGARTVAISVDQIDIGNPGTAPVAPGLELTPATLARLLAGDPTTGAPATDRLRLTALGAMNFFGTTGLTLARGTGSELDIATPAIYGLGAAGDVATIAADRVVWSGVAVLPTSVSNQPVNVSALPGAPVAGGAGSGSGQLQIQADDIVLGEATPGADVQAQSTLDRLALGFAGVTLTGDRSISGNETNRLFVYQNAAAEYGQPGTGGTLTLVTPVLTADRAAKLSFTAGAALNLLPLAADQNLGARALALGGGIDLAAPTIDVTGTIALPSGRLAAVAAGDITLGDTARIDVAGRSVTLFDVTENLWGGSVTLESAGSSVRMASGAAIDLSARGADAGDLEVTAKAGTVDLAGAIGGSADTANTAGSIDLRAGLLPDFAGLMARLDAGGVFGRRAVEVGQGDLVVDGTLRANQVSLSADAGALTVNGTIDASGRDPGTIALAAHGNLVLGPTSRLDVHETVLHVDSYLDPATGRPGTPIAALNTGHVALTSAAGTVVLQGGGLDASSPDGVARGELVLNAPRTLAGRVMTQPGVADGIAVEASVPTSLAGFANAEVYGWLTEAPGTQDGLAIVNQSRLTAIDRADTAPFMARITAGGNLAAQLASLAGIAVHVRPGVEIATQGDLAVTSDLDLAGYRYGNGVVTGQRGSGEPGALRLRAGGNLTIGGSVTDGFDIPKDIAGTPNPDDAGWVLLGGTEPTQSPVQLPQVAASLDGVTQQVTLSGGLSTFDTTGGLPLDYDVTLSTAKIKDRVVIPVAFALADPDSPDAYRFPSNWVATATIRDANGVVLFARGTVVPAGTLARTGWQFDRDTVLPFEPNATGLPGQDGLVWTAGASLKLFDGGGVGLAVDTVLAPGALIPGGANTFLSFADGSDSEILRTPGSDGKQGSIWFAAPMLKAGSLSASIALVAGADMAAADPLATRAHSGLAGTGNLTLADTHYATIATSASPAPSVIRTGTGALDIAVGGDFAERSLWGIYTAGSQTAGVARPYRNARGSTAAGSVLGDQTYDPYVSNYTAYYPDGGGALTVRVQGNATGRVLNAANAAAFVSSENVGNTVWRQGRAGVPGVSDQAAAWWINFGTYVNEIATPTGSPDGTIALAGFTGFGTLGGGNVAVSVGGDAGGRNGSDALDILVASTGRVGDGSLQQTGGGRLALRVAGTLNPTLVDQEGGVANAASGEIGDLRGDIRIRAGAVGSQVVDYGNVVVGTTPLPNINPETPSSATQTGGLVVTPGDGTVVIQTAGDLVLHGAGDPGRGLLANQQDITIRQGGTTSTQYSTGFSSFSLWTRASAITLISAGGDITPSQQGADTNVTGFALDDSPVDGRAAYPATLRAVAASGNIFTARPNGGPNAISELAPSPTGQLELLAALSIDNSGYSYDMSGANADSSVLASPFRPGFTGRGMGGAPLTNQFIASPGALFAFGPDTPTTALHAADPEPNRFYAAAGSLFAVQTGDVVTRTDVSPTTWYLAAKPAVLRAGLDILSSGSGFSASGYGNVVLNLDAREVSVLQAGRDIRNAYVYVAGSGQLAVTAGRDLYQGDQGLLRSLGPLFDINPANRNGGAGIAVTVGTGAAGPDYAALEAAYLDPARVLGAGQPLAADGSRVARDYLPELITFLQTNYGLAATQANARTIFDTLDAEQRAIFLRQVYFAELVASGREQNDPTAVRYRSYLRGRNAIATLFPGHDPDGTARSYAGSLTLFSAVEGGVTQDAGISTQFGGSIQVLTPGGSTVLGVSGGVAPGANTGLVTFGSGDIDVFGRDSVLLGQSRIFTTFGGNIAIWSAQGDINAGVGSKTTLVFQPPRITYDRFGGLTLAPSVPTSGAGIATLSLIPGVPAGDVDLIAPQGTIDAGEAGIRVSGNLNLAALAVANAANVQVQGKTTGAPTIAVANVGALTAASAAAGAAQNQAQQAAQNQAAGRNAGSGSIITVEILGFGG